MQHGLTKRLAFPPAMQQGAPRRRARLRSSLSDDGRLAALAPGHTVEVWRRAAGNFASSSFGAGALPDLHHHAGADADVHGTP